MSRVRMAKLLNRCIPEIRGQKVVWKPENIYPNVGYWRMHKIKLDVMSWTASAYPVNGKHPIWNGGCWETMTECLKAGEVHIYGMYNDTIAPGKATC